MGLTKKQRAFIEYYLQDWNATQAALKAGYSKRSAASIGNENLLKPEIQAEIQRRLSEIAMSADEVLTALAGIGRASVDDIMDVDSSGRLSFNFRRAQEQGKLHLIKSVTPTQSGTKVELHDRMKALELLGKHHKLFTDNVNINDGKAIKVRLTDGDD